MAESRLFAERAAQVRILIAQSAFLGDVILSTPVIAALKALYPRAELWFLTTPLAAQLLQRDPFLSGIVEIDKRGSDAGLRGLMRLAKKLEAMQFLKVYGLHRSYRSSLLLALARIPERIGFRDAALPFLYHRRMKPALGTHDVLRRLSILGNEKVPSDTPQDLRLFAPLLGECSSLVQQRVPEPGRYAVLHPGSEWETKRWWWQGYREVAQYLLGKGMPVLVCGAQNEREYNLQISSGLKVIDLTSLTTLQDFLYVLGNAAILVCNDSMSLHAASALKTPAVAVFCATSPAFGFGPWMNKAIVVEKKGLPCKPCSRHGGRSCPTATEECMRALNASSVIEALEELLQHRV